MQVPRGATHLELDFQCLTPVNANVGPVVMTSQQLFIDWNTVLLYPAGYFARRIPAEAQLKLPTGWKAASALDVASVVGPDTRYRATTIETLVDSPVLAGVNLKRYDISAAATPVFLDVVAEQPELLELKPEVVDQHRALVREASQLFGSQHFDHYDFLYSIGDTLSFDITLEHLRSGAYGLPANEFTDWEHSIVRRDDLAHEFVHSWDGKFRRPADLWTPNFNVPMRNSLLWLYEGGTEYWGMVLTARAGL